MRALQERFISPPILRLPRKEKRYPFDKDASDPQIETVSLQKQEYNVYKPAVYCSNALKDRQLNAHSTNHDWLAVVWEILLISP